MQIIMDGVSSLTKALAALLYRDAVSCTHIQLVTLPIEILKVDHVPRAARHDEFEGG